MSNEIPKPSSNFDAKDQKILELCHRHEKLQAIAYCKDTTGWDLKTAKEYVERLELEHASKTGKPVIIERGGLRGCWLSVGLFCFIIWVGFIGAFVFYMEKDKTFYAQEGWFRPMILSIMGLFSLPGFIFLIYFIRKECDEKIEISSAGVNYFKKGWLHKTQDWYEPLINYQGVAAITEDGTDDTAVYTVILKHETNKDKNILLQENIESKVQQTKLKEDYARILKVPALRG